MLVILIILFVGLTFVLGASIARFSERVGYYTTQLNGQLDSFNALLERLGLSNVHLQDVLKPSALTSALSAVLSGIAGFLSDLFLILMIMLFLLGEGPAMMNRLRASVSEDNPQVARLTVVGQSVVRQFGLRAIVNLVTGAGVTLLLLVLGVDFALVWLLGGPGAFLALPITLFVAVMFDTFPETRWLASLIGVSGTDTGTPAPDAEVERT